MFSSDHDLCVLRTTAETSLSSALREWKTARASLAATIESYVSACVGLRTACAVSSESKMVDEGLLMIDSELGFLESEEKTLRNIRMSLAAMRNNSTLARINTLPPEILTTIFALSSKYCVRDDTKSIKSIKNFAGVCAYWRQVAIDKAELWSHIDVGPKAQCSLIRLLLARSKNAPIHVHLFEPNPVHDDRPTPDDEVSRVTDVLRPHVDRISTLDLESYSYSRSFIGSMLNMWFDEGNPAVAKSLRIFRPKADKLLSPEGQSKNGVLRSRTANAKCILQSITRLHLQNVMFDWDSDAYRGLVDLRLSILCDSVSVTTSQLHEMLSSSREITTLKLRRLIITGPDDYTPSPVQLNQLSVLSLFLLSSSSLGRFLPLVSLPPSPTDLTVGLSVYPYLKDKLAAFFNRSHMSTLFLNFTDVSHPMALVDLFTTFSPLNKLILRNFNMDPPEGKLDSESSHTLSPSRFHSIVLMSSRVTLEGLTHIVATHGVHELNLEGCRVYDTGSLKTMGDLRNSLLEIFPELKCSISEEESGLQLFYHKIFDGPYSQV